MTQQFNQKFLFLFFLAFENVENKYFINNFIKSFFQSNAQFWFSDVCFLFATQSLVCLWENAIKVETKINFARNHNSNKSFIYYYSIFSRSENWSLDKIVPRYYFILIIFRVKAPNQNMLTSTSWMLFSSGHKEHFEKSQTWGSNCFFIEFLEKTFSAEDLGLDGNINVVTGIVRCSAEWEMMWALNDKNRSKNSIVKPDSKICNVQYCFGRVEC